MLKQHCEVCDGVIPGSTSYRTVHFGRGNNPNINIGRDPMVICKNCWKKMLASVGVSMVESEEQYERGVEKTVEKEKQRADALGKEIADFVTAMSPENLLKGRDRACETCKYGSLALKDEPCKFCTGKDKWEAKNGNTNS